ncbi:DUF3822 family protein [Lacinutrix sp. C3R15]|uniref:DUF3822 family protein n=1 Tax=Flavobacteriaceae TaxID=49546 RepID=UPI001C094847|nr:MULTISPECIES: DUF3822 family protein [Flavobacteriaceae]MBU2940111.1 DUF3822 family protein [Lacinutrix sp. C3R15]MDO6623428.1 DUF3822 family protein [Oceanihabitans sp. 1_MG-2023]
MAIASKQKKTLTNQELSIQISLNGLSFCILKSNTNIISCCKHFAFTQKQTPYQVLHDLKTIFDTIPEFQGHFNTIHVIYINELSTLIPKSLFNEDAIADYLKFNSKILQTDYIAHDEIAINNSINVYVPYININNYLYDKFGTFAYKHYSTILIEEILLAEKDAQDQKMYVHVNKNHFEIVVTYKGELILYNTFTYITKEDFIYYILFTAEQLQLNVETLKLLLLGDIVEDDALYNIVFKYIRHVQFGKPNTNYITEEEEIIHYNYILKHSF